MLLVALLIAMMLAPTCIHADAAMQRVTNALCQSADDRHTPLRYDDASGLVDR
jgi:hypothetical protein